MREAPSRAGPSPPDPSHARAVRHFTQLQHWIAPMKAVLCKSFGPPEGLTVEDVPSPEPKDDQVVIAVHAAAVNFPDTLIVQNK